MSGSIGSTPQITPNTIQNSMQNNAQQSVQRQTQQPQRDVAQAPQQNQNFQQLAQEIIAQRASGETQQQQATQRGQVVDLLV